MDREDIAVVDTGCEDITTLIGIDRMDAGRVVVC